MKLGTGDPFFINLMQSIFYLGTVYCNSTIGQLSYLGEILVKWHLSKMAPKFEKWSYYGVNIQNVDVGQTDGKGAISLDNKLMSS